MVKYWLWLTTRKWMSGAGLSKVLEHFGTPQAAFFADPREYDLVPGINRQGKSALLDKSLAEAERILEDCHRLGQRILTVGDATYPERLRNIYDPPCVLYLRGHDLLVDDQVVVALVGTRTPTPYGIQQAERMGQELARQGALVVSGLARGLDTAGLRGAMRGGGRVVGVLGNGLDVIYPPENRSMYEDVTAAGTLVSEYPPGSEPAPFHFPIRNRIISGLSLGVVVVEGGARSGTLITARAALEQNRDIFAIPGGVDAPMSGGPNQLIRRGEAVLVTSAADVLEDYRAIYPHKLRPLPQPLDPREPQQAPVTAPTAKAAVEDKPQLKTVAWSALQATVTDDQRDILTLLEGGVLDSEAIIERTQIPARRMLSAITMLQVAGLVAEEPGRRFRATVKVLDN